MGIKNIFTQRNVDAVDEKTETTLHEQTPDFLQSSLATTNAEVDSNDESEEEEDTLDEDYEEALCRVLEIRKERSAQYGDTWKEMEDWECLALIKQKYRRLEEFVLNRREDGDDIYDKKIDTLIDLVNYTLFLLANEVRENEE